VSISKPFPMYSLLKRVSGDACSKEVDRNSPELRPVMSILRKVQRLSGGWIQEQALNAAKMVEVEKLHHDRRISTNRAIRSEYR